MAPVSATRPTNDVIAEGKVDRLTPPSTAEGGGTIETIGMDPGDPMGPVGDEPDMKPPNGR